MELGTLPLVLLIVFGLLAGVGITALGPGGILVTIGLLLVTDAPPAVVAGTALVTHIFTGLLGAAAYRRSGQLRQPATLRTARMLALAALVGTPVGVLVNQVVPVQAFGLGLAALVVVIAVLLMRRRREQAADVRHGMMPLILIGAGVSAVCGMFGLGGPVLAVPLLVAVGTPVLAALGAAQVQAIVIATIGTIGYLLQGSVDWGLALLVGVPELIGVVLGWRIAQLVPERILRRTMIVALLVMAPFIALP